MNSLVCSFETFRKPIGSYTISVCKGTKLFAYIKFNLVKIYFPGPAWNNLGTINQQLLGVYAKTCEFAHVVVNLEKMKNLKRGGARPMLRSTIFKIYAPRD